MLSNFFEFYDSHVCKFGDNSACELISCQLGCRRLYMYVTCLRLEIMSENAQKAQRQTAEWNQITLRSLGKVVRHVNWGRMQGKFGLFKLNMAFIMIINYSLFAVTANYNNMFASECFGGGIVVLKITWISSYSSLFQLFWFKAFCNCFWLAYYMYCI